MSLSVTGLSHKSSPVELRERLAYDAPDLPAALRRLHRDFPGCAILSTCNRVEIYAHGTLPAEETAERMRQFLSETRGIERSLLEPLLYDYHERDAVAHLYKVCAGLDSLVVGEAEVLGQVHDAYLAAQTENTADKVLGTLFQRAFKVAKEIRTKSNIGAGKVSVASVAVDLAVHIFSDLKNKVVLVIGSGDTGELVLKSLVGKGVGRVLVANRTLETARALAESYGGEALPLEALRGSLHLADIVISSTASPEPLLGVEEFQQALKLRDQEPMFVIDIAVPRDIASAVNTLSNVYLYDIDDLRQVADQNHDQRRAEVARCLDMVDAQVGKFMAWRHSLHAEPTIVSMSQELHAIRERELKKTLDSLPDLTEKQREEVVYLSKRIVNNILQRPLSQIKQEVVEEDPHRMLHLVKRLFGLEEGT